jgi:hypothetical protein
MKEMRVRFEEFTQAVDDAARRASDPVSATSAFVELGRTMQIGRHWRELIASAQQCIVNDTLRRGSSHDHENGFQKIGLFRSNSTGVQIRLHIWYSDTARDVSGIHDHRWDFASFVFVGGLFARNFKIVDSANPAQGSAPYLFRRLFDAVSESEREEVKESSETGECLLSISNEYEALAGAAHSLAHDVPHIAFPVSGMPVTASLVITGMPSRNYSTQFEAVDKPERLQSKSGKRTLFDNRDCSDRIVEFLARSGE